MDFACTYQRKLVAKSASALFLLNKIVLKIKYLYPRISVLFILQFYFTK